jgi:hypothetical protein
MNQVQSRALAVRYISDKGGKVEHIKFDCTRFPPDDENQCLPMDDDLS